MRALIYEGKETIAVREVDMPELNPGEVLIKVAFTGICGSDLGIYNGKHPRAQAPLIMGHELSGVIVDQNAAKDVAIGDHVTVNPLISCGKCPPCVTGDAHVCESLRLFGFDRDGGFAEYVKVDAANLVKLPKDLPLEDAALVEPVAVAVHAVRKSALKLGDTVVVLGGGPIGLLTALVARAAGAGKVWISEISPERRRFAEKLGFKTFHPDETTLDRIRALNAGKAADLVFEVAGVEATALLATQIIKNTGQIIIVSVFKQPAPVDLQSVNFKEISMIGVRVYTASDFQAALELVIHDPSFRKLITHRLPLEEAQTGFDLMKKSTDSMKILIHP